MDRKFPCNKPWVRWGVLWRSENKLDGRREHLLDDGASMPALFHTRDDARRWIRERYSFIRTRPDLRAEPHGWKMPIPTRVTIFPIP